MPLIWRYCIFLLSCSYCTKISAWLTTSASPSAAMMMLSASTNTAGSSVVDRSTLTLLEHVNLNIPNHEHIDFYYKVLGCGVDPRKAMNLRKPETTGTSASGTAPTTKTIWANAGASQFHLPFGSIGQRIQGQIGLYYHQSLDRLKERIQEYPSSYANVEMGQDETSKREFVILTDHYGNIFVCRVKDEVNEVEKTTTTTTNAGDFLPRSRQRILRQPIVASTDIEKWDTVATAYGIDGETECRGIQYVEFLCPPGSAGKIALFYESLLDATTNVVGTVAIIAIGDIYGSGQSEQCLLFRETSEEIPPYDGHHIALYVGQNAADFEQAFRNAQMADIVWKNPRFSDQVDSLEEAQKERQFRFKDILDIETGDRIMELEHEMRSIEHSSWPEVKT